MTDLLTLAYLAWPDETPPAVARLRDAIEKTNAAARALGLDPDELYAAQAPWQLRADAWCHRMDQLLGCREVVA
jgi:hypothetical protein